MWYCLDSIAVTLVDGLSPTSIIGFSVGLLRQVYVLMDHRVRSFLDTQVWPDSCGIGLHPTDYKMLRQNEGDDQEFALNPSTSMSHKYGKILG